MLNLNYLLVKLKRRNRPTMRQFIRFLFIVCLLCTSFLLQGQDKPKDGVKYQFIVRLIDSTPLTPDCGIFAFAVAQKFQVLSNCLTLKNRFIIVINPCPELQQVGLLKKGFVYDVVAVSRTKYKDFAVVNNYVKEKLPTFWAEEIKLKKP